MIEGVSGVIRKCVGCALVSETAQVELSGGRVYAPAIFLRRDSQDTFNAAVVVSDSRLQLVPCTLLGESDGVAAV